MSNDDCIALAVRNGWQPMSTLVQLDNLPQFRRDNIRMWRNPAGVTVAEIQTTDNVSRYARHRYYSDVAAAVKAEGPANQNVLDDL